MKGLLEKVKKLSEILSIGGGVMLVFMMCLTVMDVILRAFNRPIVGTYEIVAFSEAVVLSLVNPLTSWKRQHICVDFFILSLGKKTRKVVYISTRCLAIWLFLMIGWNLVDFGTDLWRSGELSATLTLPFYPIAYGVGLCSFIQCLVFICDILRTIGEKDE